jgi:hypothetical protein
LSSPRSIKETYTHTGRRVLRSSGLNQYKSLCSSWCSSHPLLQDPTHCSILLAGGKNTDSWHVGRGSDVGCFLKLVNLAIDMDHRSLNGVFSLKGRAPQPFSPLMHGSLPLIGAPPLAPLRIPSCGATPPMDPVHGEADHMSC